MTSPRERMVVSAALLIRERGAQPTAIADVLEHSGAPRGSAYHYFPGGRTQLLCEAIDYAGEYIAAKIATAENAVCDALDGLIADYRKQLLRSDYRAGCPDRRGDGGSRRPRQARPRDAGDRPRGGGLRALDRPDRANAWWPTACPPRVPKNWRC